MKANKSNHRRVRKGGEDAGKGTNVVGDVNAVVVANTGKGGLAVGSRSVSRQRIVQRNGETVRDAREYNVEIEGGGE